MFKCNCGKEYKKQRSLNSHARFCDQYIKKDTQSKYKISENLYRCECDKEFDNYQSLNGHLSHCNIHNPNKNKDIRNNAFNNKRGWSKGLTKETSESVKNQGLQYSENIKNGITKPSFIGKKHNIESLKKMSIKRIEKIDSHNGFCKWYNVFNGEKIIKVQGTWEKRIAETLTRLNIKWERGFKMPYGEYKHYLPDFYLSKYNMFLEIKGYWYEKDILKMKAVISEHELINIKVIDSLKDIEKFENKKLKINKLKDIRECI